MGKPGVFPAGIGADGRQEEGESLEEASREGVERGSDPLGNHRQQPGIEGDEPWRLDSTPRSSSAVFS